MSLQVASRPAPARGRPPSTTRDQVAGVAASMTAFVRWVAHPEEDLEAHLAAGYRRLAWAFADLA